MKKVLLVEDSGVFREVEITLLKKIEKISIVISVNLKEAITQLNTNEFDLIICDYQLPDGTGLDYLKMVRENGRKTTKGVEVPFLMVTGNNDMDIVKDCIKQGVTDYLVKPLQAVLFLQKCCKQLELPMPKL
ncbi:response regulator [Marinicellulosiphila megalodicopiae]|uniref:response regulator n=1 Tax=Marinicellulosiphila megalodicopiae TaxID=2724896 RepID=UPI003BB117EB